MPRCRHGSFQDTEYGIHGNQYDMFLVHFQSILKKKQNFTSQLYRSTEKRNHIESFLHLWTATWQERKAKIPTCKNYLGDDYLEEINKCTVLSKSGKVAVEKYKVLRMMQLLGQLAWGKYSSLLTLENALNRDWSALLQWYCHPPGDRFWTMRKIKPGN